MIKGHCIPVLIDIANETSNGLPMAFSSSATADVGPAMAEEEKATATHSAYSAIQKDSVGTTQTLFTATVSSKPLCWATANGLAMAFSFSATADFGPAMAEKEKAIANPFAVAQQKGLELAIAMESV